MTDTERAVGRPEGAKTFDATVATAFGRAIRLMRKKSRMSQDALGANAGIERAHISKLERGRHMPTLIGIVRIARALQLPAHELVKCAEDFLPSDYVPPLRGG